MTTRAAIPIAAAAALAGAALWWRRHPSACPYSQRVWVEVPHPFITRARLREALNPQPGERVLEVGPGTGYYTLDMAAWLDTQGHVDILDLQQEMLDHTMRRAATRGLTNITPTLGDARQLPYDDHSFDAAYLVAVLGEIPDQEAALRELARVLKPGGRLVVGELLGDPHWVSPGKLRRQAETASLRLERRLGRLAGHYTVLTRYHTGKRSDFRDPVVPGVSTAAPQTPGSDDQRASAPAPWSLLLLGERSHPGADASRQLGASG